MPSLHPVNYLVWEVFEYLRTQIRVAGMGDFVGYDFSLLPLILEARGIPKYEWADILEGLTVINNTSLKIVRESQENKS